MQEIEFGFEKQQGELDGVIRSYRYTEESLVVAEIEKGALPALTEDKTAWDCQFLLFLWKENEEQCLRFFSDTNKIRALEFLDYLLPEFGLVRGDALVADGRVADAILQVQMSDVDLTESTLYFLKRIWSYFYDCDCIVAEEYGNVCQSEIRSMKMYLKKRIPWAFVRTRDVVREGETICIKSLENESGLEVVSGDDHYIMIGFRGEIYDIKREKFVCTYEATEEPLDVFAQMMDMLPVAEIQSTGNYVDLEEVAHLCYPKNGAGIYAKPLEKRTKVFPKGEGQEYFLGRPGDYLAVRPDDDCDIYVIEREIFSQTYEEAQDAGEKPDEIWEQRRN